MCSQSSGTIRWSHFRYGCPFRPPSCHYQHGQYWKIVTEPLFARDSYRKISNAQGSSTRVASMSRASTCSDSFKNPLRVMAGVQDMIEEADCLQGPNLVLRFLLYTRAQRYFTERLIGTLVKESSPTPQYFRSLDIVLPQARCSYHVHSLFGLDLRFKAVHLTTPALPALPGTNTHSPLTSTFALPLRSTGPSGLRHERVPFLAFFIYKVSRKSQRSVT
jgi:hypothetical protein